MVVNTKIIYYKILNSCILSIYIYIILRHTLIIGDRYSNYTSYAISIILLSAY
jgi:hypothetical protein